MVLCFQIAETPIEAEQRLLRLTLDTALGVKGTDPADYTSRRQSLPGAGAWLITSVITWVPGLGYNSVYLGWSWKNVLVICNVFFCHPRIKGCWRVSGIASVVTLMFSLMPVCITCCLFIASTANLLTKQQLNWFSWIITSIVLRNRMNAAFDRLLLWWHMVALWLK